MAQSVLPMWIVCASL